MMRVEKGEERRRAAVLDDIMSIAVADSGFLSPNELGGGWMKNSKWHRSGTHFSEKVGTMLGPKMRWISGGIKRYEAQQNS